VWGQAERWIGLSPSGLEFAGMLLNFQWLGGGRV
jgi:hypothetical protein